VAEVPVVVAKIAADSPIRLVWENGLGGRTYRVDRADCTAYVKWAPDPPEVDLELETLKLAWTGRYIRVPEVLSHGRDSESSGWLHRGNPGMSAIAPQWKAEPRVACGVRNRPRRRSHQLPPPASGTRPGEAYPNKLGWLRPVGSLIMRT
jgi:kanamycin kinase